MKLKRWMVITAASLVVAAGLAVKAGFDIAAIGKQTADEVTAARNQVEAGIATINQAVSQAKVEETGLLREKVTDLSANLCEQERGSLYAVLSFGATACQTERDQLNAIAEALTSLEELSRQQASLTSLLTVKTGLSAKATQNAWQQVSTKLNNLEVPRLQPLKVELASSVTALVASLEKLVDADEHRNAKQYYQALAASDKAYTAVRQDLNLAEPIFSSYQDRLATALESFLDR